MAVYLVTGAGGFIGSWLTQALVERGETVRALDNFSTGKRGNLTPWQNDIRFLKSICAMRIGLRRPAKASTLFSMRVRFLRCPCREGSAHQPHREY